MFKELYEKALYEKTMKAKKERSTKHNHPSELTTCARQFWYKVKGYEISDIPSLSMMLIWEQGHALHESLGKLTEMIPDIEEFDLEASVKVRELYNLGGHSDLVCKVKGKWYVVDFKTIGTTKFKELKKNGLPEAYLWQVNLYMYMLKQMNPEKFKDLDTAYVLFLNKNPLPDEIMQAQSKRYYKATSPFEEIMVKYDEDLLQTVILPQAEYLQEVRKMEQPPEREGKSKKDEKCMFCEYRTLCFKSKK